MELIKGKSYLIKGFKDKQTAKELAIFNVVFPQYALFDGEFLLLKDITSNSQQYSLNHFDLSKLKKSKPNTLEIYPYRGGFRYRKIAANGKVLNHHYNTVAGAKKGAEAERKFWENFKIIVKK